jgi:hypothetical protein
VVHKATINTLKEGQDIGGKVILLNTGRFFRILKESSFNYGNLSALQHRSWQNFVKLHVHIILPEVPFQFVIKHIPWE